MSGFDAIIIVFWLIFAAYWLISAIGVKSARHENGAAVLRGAGIRIAFAVVVLLVVLPLRRTLATPVSFFSNPVVDSIGVAFCALGLGCALWARVSLGRNWGMPMTRKVEPELVSRGPYAVVRHPIYAGLILAIFGTFLLVGLRGLIALAIFCPYFLYSAALEERLMTEALPRQYLDYKRRTKMLIPFIF